ncbi:18261_t:CDS:2, partial [Funneliformis geosporum]
REATITDTPKDYEKLYKKCWDQEPKQRPIITEILEEFSMMKFINKPIKNPKTRELYTIMEYANGGNLQIYLENNFEKLTWNDKKQLAYQIADG